VTAPGPAAAGTSTTADLLAVLDVAESGEDRFIGTSLPMHLPRIFGGQVLAQALIAADRTVAAGKVAHSLHAYFLRAGDPDVPVEFAVERVRDGRQLSCRSVAAIQHGRPIATMTTSFAAPSGGVTHQVSPPVTPPVEGVITLTEAAVAWGGLHPVWDGLDMMDIRVDPRRVEPSGDRFGMQEAAEQAWTDHVWQRVPGALPDDEIIHQALLVYLSDTTLLSSALVPHGVLLGEAHIDGELWDGMSLDHAVWFHQPVRADRWLLFEQSSPAADGGRALSRAAVFSDDSRLVASVAQECLFRGIATG
jgi:acyl-CoA thioesterase II